MAVSYHSSQKPLILTKNDIIEYSKDSTLLSKTNLKNISCVVFPKTTSKPSYIKFWSDHIYEFKIDYYKTGEFDGHGFFEYAKVVYDSNNNNYKIYSYYKSNGQFKPCATTRRGEYDIIEHEGYPSEFRFKGPVFTEGFRRGKRDIWILNTSLVIPHSSNSTKNNSSA